MIAPSCGSTYWLWHQDRSRDGPGAPVESRAGTLVRGPGPPPGTAAPRRARPPTTCQVDAHDPAVGGWDSITWPCPRWVAVDAHSTWRRDVHRGGSVRH